ncbi:glycosyltransferase [Christensenellaceae bacterium OttesenSCG-928-K19]|nr:glycosyltransferase [Christensenellaceae bacterium OttesenSCG-928-K19]
MMPERLISVVIPSYNYEHYLPQAVSSVVFQTHPNLELVIVDDASIDGSAAVIKSLEQQYAGRFSGGMQVLLKQRNEGAHAAINTGIRSAKGELIAILNADDLYESNRLELMAQAMGDSARFAFSAVRCIDEHWERLQTEQAQAFEAIQRKISGKRFVALSAMAENVAISTGNLLFEKKLFSELGGFKNYKYVHDYDFFLRACLLAEPIFVQDTAYLYRLHGQNSFTRLAEEGLRENRMVWLDVYRDIRKGRVQNPVILQNPDYIAEFYTAVCSEGEKKQKLWKLSLNPAIRAGVAVLKKRHHVEGT